MWTKKHYCSILGLELEDNHNFSGKWKMTSIFRQMEDDLIFKANERQPQFQRQMENDLNI